MAYASLFRYPPIHAIPPVKNGWYIQGTGRSVWVGSHALWWIVHDVALTARALGSGVLWSGIAADMTLGIIDCYEISMRMARHTWGSPISPSNASHIAQMSARGGRMSRQSRAVLEQVDNGLLS